MRIVLDTAILIRAHDGGKGLARDLLLRLIESDHVLLISDEMLYELAKVLRYPRMSALHGLSEGRIFDYAGSCVRPLKSFARTHCWSRRFGMSTILLSCKRRSSVKLT